jgi:hypothetical protein
MRQAERDREAHEVGGDIAPVEDAALQRGRASLVSCCPTQVTSDLARTHRQGCLRKL